MDVWKNEKAKIDQLDENGLVDYIESNEHKAHDTPAYEAGVLSEWS